MPFKRMRVGDYRIIKQLGEEGKTILLVEHNLEVVRNVATSVYYLANGGIRAHGTYEELTSNPELAESYFGVSHEQARIRPTTQSTATPSPGAGS